MHPPILRLNDFIFPKARIVSFGYSVRNSQRENEHVAKVDLAAREIDACTDRRGTAVRKPSCPRDVRLGRMRTRT